MNCKACDKQFTGLACYNQHIASEKHKKKMMLFQMNNAPNGSPTSEPQALNINTFPCEVCSVKFYSLSDFMQHSSSEEHAKRVLNKMSQNAMVVEEAPVCNSTTVDFPVNGSGLNHPDLISHLNKDSNFSNYSRCELCDKCFSGPESYNQHIVSAGHRKKSALNASQTGNQNNVTLDIVPSNASDRTFNDPLSFQLHENIAHVKTTLAESNSEKVNSPSYSSFNLNGLVCEICNLTCTGPIPYNQHMESKAHMKMVERKQLVIQLNKVDGKENRGEDVTDSKSKSWNCEVCNKMCSGPEPYREHLNSEKHRKNVEAKENRQEGVNDSKPKQFSAWYCEVCDKICSGPNPYREHLSSSSHIKNVAKTGAEEKQNEIRSIMSHSPGEVDIFSNPKSATADFNMMEDSRPSGVPKMPEQNVNDSGESSASFPGVDLSNLNLTIFKVGEEIDFDQKEKSDISISEMDVNYMEQDDDEIEEGEITYDDMPSP